MLERFKPKTNFTRNVLTLLTGTTLSQALPIIASPILTRIYTPSEFGVFAFFMSILTILGTVTNGRYDVAIMLPKKDTDAINLLAAGFLINCIMVFFIIVIILVGYDYFTELLTKNEIYFNLFIIPLSVFLVGIFNLFNYYNNRRKYYKSLANANIVKSVIIVAIQLILGYIKLGATGLVSGQILGQLVANWLLFKKIILNTDNFFSKIKLTKIICISKRYKNFPKYSTWAILCNTSSYHLTNLLISSLFSVATLGFYFLVQRVMAMPSSLIGNSISQVFYEAAKEERHHKGDIEVVFNKTLKKLVLIAIPFFTIMYFIVEDLFAFVFGEEWRIAGEYAVIVIPFFCVRFIASSLSVVLFIYEKQKIEILWQFLLMTLTIITIYICTYHNISFVDTLEWLNLIWVLHYLILLSICINIIKCK